MSHFLRPYEILLTPDGPRLVVSAGADGGEVKLLDQETNTTTSIAVSKLRKLLTGGQWSRAVKNYKTGKVTALNLSKAALSMQRFNIEVLKRIEPHVRDGLSIREAYLMHANDSIEIDGKLKAICSLRTVQRLMKKAEKAGLELIPLYAERGNRRARYDERIDNIILSLAEQKYSTTKSRLTIGSLTEAVNQDAKELLPEGVTLSRKFVKRKVIENWHPDRDYRRLDRRVARALKAVARHRIRVEGPLHRVEQDTVHLPFIVYDKNYGIIDVLFLMLAIDCASSMPLAWLLVTRPVTTEDTLNCLEIGMNSKEQYFEKFEIKCDVDPYGNYLQLVIDNGSENLGERIDNLTTLGIDVTRTPAFSGHLKPFIERLNRSLKEGLEGLPGCTRFNGKDGERTDEAVKDPLLTLEQLERWIVRWLYEKWIHTPLDRFITADYALSENLGLTPAARWRSLEAKYPIPLPPDPSLWIQIAYQEVTPVLNRKNGVAVEGFKFRGDNLVRLLNQYSEGSKIRIRYNPSDYRFVYAFDKHTDEPLILTNAELTPETPAYSFVEAKKRRKDLKATIKTPQVVRDFDSELVDASMAESPHQSKTQKRRTTTKNTKTQEAADRARANPVPSTSPTHSVPSDEVYITTDAVPEFDTIVKPKRPQ